MKYSMTACEMSDAVSNDMSNDMSSVPAPCNESNDRVVSSVEALSAKITELIACISAAHPELSPAASGSQAKTGGANAKVKRTRTKSAYNVHMSKQLSELKQTHPTMGHRERFAMAVKSWPRPDGPSAGGAPTDGAPRDGAPRETAEKPGDEATRSGHVEGDISGPTASTTGLAVDPIAQ